MYLGIISVLLCWSFVLSSDEGGAVTGGGGSEDTCGQCSTDPEKLLQSLREQIKKIKMPLEFAGSCKSCVFTGLADFDIVPGTKVCVQQTQSGSIVRQATLEWKNVTWQCPCKLSLKPLELIPMMVQTLTDKPTMQCTPKGIQKFLTMKSFPQKIEESDVKDLQTCIPALFKALLDAFKTKNFKIGGGISKLRMYVEYVTFHGDPNGHLRNLEILNKDGKGLKQYCEGPESLIKGCKCLLETNYIGFVYMASTRATLPCIIEAMTDEYPGSLNVLNKCRPK